MMKQTTKQPWKQLRLRAGGNKGYIIQTVASRGRADILYKVPLVDWPNKAAEKELNRLNFLIDTPDRFEMEPYYQEDGQTIYHGDCREILPTLDKVDLVLTDPPYGIGEANGKPKQRGKLAVARDYLEDTWDTEPIDDCTMRDIRNAGKWAVIFGGNYYEMPPTSCWLVWDKENGDTDFADCELAWTNLKKAVRIKRHRWHGMLRKNNEYRNHPTQKPLDLFKWCIGHAPDAQTILDPFMGSGTTLRAAKDLRRQAIGIEIEEKYCEIAANRLRQKVLDF